MSKFSRRDFIIKAPASAATAAYIGATETDAETSSSKSAGGSHSARDVESTQPLDTRQVFSSSIRDTYEGDHLDRIAFSMGGIGAGCISLSATGKLIDWEIFNNPNRGYQPYYSFLSVFAQQDGGKPAFRVLEGQLRGSFEGPLYVTKDMWQDGNGCGPQQTETAGLPRMRQCKFVGRFLFAQVGKADDSSIPIAALNVTLHNPDSKVVKAAVALSVQNCAGGFNEAVHEDGFSAVYMHAGSGNENAMFIASPQKADSWQLNWTGSMLFMYLQHFVDTFGRTGKLDQSAANPGMPIEGKDNPAKVGSLAFEMTLQPGQSKTVPALSGWYFPIFDTATPAEMNPGAKPWRNWYGQQWKSGLEVARYAVANLQRLETESRLFQERFFSSMSVSMSPALVRFAIMRPLNRFTRSYTLCRDACA